MKWTFVKFSEPSDGKGIKFHMLHPMIAKRRIADVCGRYGVTVTDTEKREEAWMDFGGMVFIDAHQVQVDLGGGRKFGCWQHQLSEVVDELKKHLTSVEKGGFIRFFSWPHLLIFMSVKDAKTIIKALEPQISHADEQAVKDAAFDVLVNAAAKNDPETPKEVLRKILRRGRNVVASDKVN